eukprot:CAMPEP_0183311368 /NCGR_PEP_ID=MMETSP0160_2-20130417/36546_1 /TAXON_ID=2839 ORGANISM="Odontella Sinensis, Strain Grunow 1884" /NCGR_SAMPLE_ID=MMETSP0160_2 /ASSEMBLY_ACC=CAM_ASM_000250 /LENGTH=255 /DNA_ID=CAMNT_0025475915 /DNA_START=36 /DNA_END=799 /DNA_ORIENTATION=-
MAENKTEDMDPNTVFLNARREREATFSSLCTHLKDRKSGLVKKFEHCYKVLTLLGGYREVHKYLWIMIIYMFRKRVLEEAQSLKKSRQIKSLDEAFSLHLDELEMALKDPFLPIQTMIENNMDFRIKTRNIQEYPMCFDSRGKIIRPPSHPLGPRELAGRPISPGLVKGRVKVLRRADEKPILPGEILVARATDPGWTPLFVNAGGIILEVGGLLQHGALVAREYGKPCVSGIENVVSLLNDGQIVELDGASGVV